MQKVLVLCALYFCNDWWMSQVDFNGKHKDWIIWHCLYKLHDGVIRNPLSKDNIGHIGLCYIVYAWTAFLLFESGENYLQSSICHSVCQHSFCNCSYYIKLNLLFRSIPLKQKEGLSYLGLFWISIPRYCLRTLILILWMTGYYFCCQLI